MTRKLLMLFLFALMVPVTTAIAQPNWRIVPDQCGEILPSLNTNIQSEPIQGATSYRFRVLVGSQEFVVDRPIRSLNLSSLPTVLFGTTYQVQVSPRIGGVFQPYGPICEVTTPTPVTSVSSAQCGTILPTMSTSIFADLVANASGYRFRIQNASNPAQVFYVDKLLREFKMTQIGALPGTTYTVQVAVRNLDGNYLPYGPACSITTPVFFTTLESQYCNSVLGSMYDPIKANIVPHVTMYRFKLINLDNPDEVKTIDRVLRSFSMAQVGGISFNTTYLISVAVRDNDNNWMPYGEPCAVTTPGIPLAKIQLSQCDLHQPDAGMMIFADIIPNATMYRFRIESQGYSEQIDRPTRCFNLNMFSGLQPNSEYTVRVAAMINGSFGDFGKACTIVTPWNTGISRMAPANLIKENVTTAFPNPFSDAFHISAPHDAPVSVSVYDLTGRKLQQQDFHPGEVAHARFGQNLPTGVYTVVVGGETGKSFRMVKR